MWRGTTPVHTFTLPEGIALNDFAVVYVTYSQGGRVVLEKDKEELEVADGGFRLVFSQADTLCFAPGPVKIQIRGRFPDGRAVASDIVSTTVQEVLKDGEI